MQILPYARQVRSDGHVAVFEVLRRPQSRAHEKLRRADGPGTQDHLRTRLGEPFEPILFVGDADGTPAVDLNAPHVRIGHHGEIVAASCGSEVGRRRAGTLPGPLRNLVETGPVWHTGVEVGVIWVPCADGRTHDGLRERVRGLQVGDEQGAALAVVARSAARVGFEALEVRQDRSVAPSVAAVGGGPGVVVGGMAAKSNSRVHGAAAAQHVAPRPVQLARQEVLLGGGRAPPLVAFGRKQVLGGYWRSRVHRAFRLSAGCQQEHARPPVLAEATRQHPPGRAAPDDHVVVHGWGMGVRECRGAGWKNVGGGRHRRWASLLPYACPPAPANSSQPFRHRADEAAGGRVVGRVDPRHQ